MTMEQAKQTFLEESRELLQEMEDALLALEDEPADTEIVNALFRAAHTIKGSGGVFGFAVVVGFTHVVESVLGRVRDGEMPITEALSALLLRCRDHMGQLVEHAVVDGGEPGPEVLAEGQTLLEQLASYLQSSGASPPAEGGMPVAQEAEASATGSLPVESDTWHISLRFGQDVLRNGMDPLSFLRYLTTLGEIVSLTTLHEALPAAGEMDPERCYLGFEIDFKSEADKAAIEGVFGFVADDSQIHILPPHSRIVQYVEMIEGLPEDPLRLGEMLVKGGALTERELTEALALQARLNADQGEEQRRRVGEVLVDQGVVQPQVINAALNKQQQIKEYKAQQSKFVRVDTDKLGQLINLVGELVIASANTHLLAQRFADAGLLESVSVFSHLVEEIRDSALQLRMVQIGETFNRFKRVVHDVSRELGKDIELLLSGGDTELDKAVVERLGDPLMHLVRNAIDHGIEPAERRRAVGKPEQGMLRLNAYHDSGSIVIEVADDGGGIDRDKVFDKAVRAGLVSPQQSLSDHEVFRLIFEPGLSTASAVTDLSGRGVGMDVVKRAIEGLRGSIDVDSQLGVGTTLTIRLPLTLAIIDGFLVGVGNASYVVPLDTVVECLELSEQERQETQRHHYINLRGEVLPLLSLRTLFHENTKKSQRENVVVVQYAGQKAGLLVDELHGEFHTVIKPLGDVFKRLSGISGATILGSGEVALILDVQALTQQAEMQKSAEHPIRHSELPHSIPTP